MNKYFSAIVLSVSTDFVTVESYGFSAKVLIPYSLPVAPIAGDLVLCCRIDGQSVLTAILERTDSDEETVINLPAKAELRSADSAGFVSGKIIESCVEKTVTVVDSRMDIGTMNSVCSSYSMDTELASQNTRIRSSMFKSSEESSSELASSACGSSVTLVTGTKTEHAGRLCITSRGNAAIDGKLIKLG